MNLKDSKTKENLMRAFAGESQARNRYYIASEVAKNEKLFIVQEVFKYTADQERAHAKVFYDKLKEFAGENIEICGAYPLDTYTTTLELLKASHHNEMEEHDDVYKNFAKVAQEEGFPDIAATFEKIASIEKVHGDRFLTFANELENGTLFKKAEDIQWMCTHCGFVYEGKSAPVVCPVCHYPQSYYIVFGNSLFE